MIKHLVAISMLISTLNISKETQQTSPYDYIVKQIKRNKSDIGDKYAQQLSYLIYTKSIRAGVDPRLIAAILMQESNYKLDAVNKYSADYGIAQINKQTMRKLKLNKKRLLSDLDYSVSAGVQVLASFKKYSTKDFKWWGRYHNRHLKEKIKYITMVSRYL